VGALEAELERGDVACVILEPTGRRLGRGAAAPERVKSIAAAAHAHGSLVVFDEVVTGFSLVAGRGAAGDRRDSPHGAREGRRRRGLPGGALTGRADVMELLSFRPGQAKVEHPARTTRIRSRRPPGIATLDLLADGSALAGANAVAAELRAAFCAPSSSARRPVTPMASVHVCSSSASAAMTR